MKRDEAERIALDDIFDAAKRNPLPYRSQVDRATDAILAAHRMGMADAGLTVEQGIEADALALEAGNSADTMLAVAERHSRGGFVSLGLKDSLRDRGRELRKRATAWRDSLDWHFPHALGGTALCGSRSRLADQIVDVTCLTCLHDIVSKKIAHVLSLEKETLETQTAQREAERRMTFLTKPGLLDSATGGLDSTAPNVVLVPSAPVDADNATVAAYGRRCREDRAADAKFNLGATVVQPAKNGRRFCAS